MGKRILVAEKRTFSRKLIINILEGNGYTVVAEASDGEHCIEMYRELKPDLVILDTAMDEGIDVLKTLRKETPPAVVIASGTSGAASSLESIKNGAADFLLKPFRPEQVLKTVKAVSDSLT